MIDAIFLDRDGTLNVERADYVKSIDELVLLPGALAALGSLSALTVPIILITNQSVIGRGIVDQAAVDAIHAHLHTQVRASGGRLDAIYVCPHHPDAHCGCRKPQPGMLLAAAADFQLDLARCVFIGDSLSDYAAARAVGCQPVLVRTGRQMRQLEQLADSDPSVILMDDLRAAAAWLMAHEQHSVGCDTAWRSAR
ncbi:MAG TPA: D-glycero-beta-D-manno-heptose-1,7-bisphosphate 7-phosphatase [Chloroflexi bacterium]|nr:D-glycero-beta-D-manno-heptose-1,7-bisphosphate 7-phosphatase [Chloroflexota bacterium]HHW88033.1 D-glycero-beta-D-manno-heptose 1,7-bisphosphate 7-phosphatase [Chloroflexota bacterium]